MGLALSSCGLPAGGAELDGGYATVGTAREPVRLYYQDVGQGPPILLIHGFGASTYTWQKIIPDLALDHRVIAVDLKGFGRSDKPFDDHYSAFDQAKLLTQFIKQKNLHNLTIVGHSFGGGVALALALEANSQLKGRLSRLVLMDTVAYPQKVPIFFKLLAVPLVSQLGVRMVPPTLQAAEALRIAYYNPSKITQQAIDAYAEPLRSAAGKHAIIYTAREIVPPDLNEIAARYPSIKLPTLIMWCDHDYIVPMRIGLHLKRAIPNASFRLVHSCGHIPQEEEPAETLQILQTFLDKTGRQATK